MTTKEFNPAIYAYSSRVLMARAAAQALVKCIKEKPDGVMGTATGRTQEPFYRELVKLYNAGLVDFTHVKFFPLDEYVGLRCADPRSFHAYMVRRFFSRVKARPSNVYFPDGMAADLEKECARYEKAIARAGGIDWQMEGIGSGSYPHIGFNEPGSPLDGRTSVVRLTDITRRANAPAFGGDWQHVPEFAISMGLGTILDAKELLMLANGRGKQIPVNRMLTADITSETPAAIIRLHPRASLFVDWDALLPVPERFLSSVRKASPASGRTL